MDYSLYMMCRGARDGRRKETALRWMISRLRSSPICTMLPMLGIMTSIMAYVAQDDIELNNARQPATNKYVLLPQVVNAFQKVSMQIPLVENGALKAIKAWLNPLPDKSLPSLNIRTDMIDILEKVRLLKLLTRSKMFL